MSGLRGAYMLSALVIGASVLSGCDRKSQPSAPPPAAPTSPAPAAEVPAAEIAPPPPESGLQIKRGNVSLVQDHYVFQPCSSSNRWSLQGEESIEVLKKYPADSGPALFVEARGEFAQPGAVPGTAGDLVVQELLYVAPANERAGCAVARQDYKVWAGGSEPSWSVKIHGDTLILAQPGVADRVFTLGDAADAEGAAVYRAVASNSRKLELIVTQEFCRDSVTGESFGFSARASLGELHLQGCGRPGE